MNRYFAVYKPYRVLSQFSLPADEAHTQKQTLKDFFRVPTDVYPVGRLDYDSEGLLLLTNDKELNYRLLHPRFAHKREYWVQVDGAITDAAVAQLSREMTIQVHGKQHRTKETFVQRWNAEPPVPPRFPPVRFRQHIPTSWIKMVLTEGKHHQVRKMTAKAGYPTLRLLRYRIENISLDSMLPGESREYSRDEIYRLLFSHSKS